MINLGSRQTNLIEQSEVVWSNFPVAKRCKEVKYFNEDFVLKDHHHHNNINFRSSIVVTKFYFLPFYIYLLTKFDILNRPLMSNICTKVGG